MTTLKKLDALGVEYNHVISGDVVELDSYTLKDAKKQKLELVTDADIAEQVIDAYASDLKDVLEETEVLKEDKEELTAQVNSLSQENSQLNQTLQKGNVVDARIAEFENVMDDMEKSLRDLSAMKQASDAEKMELSKRVSELEAELSEARSLNDTLSAEVSRLQGSADAGHANLTAQVDELKRQNDEYVAIIQERNAELDRYDEVYTALENDVNAVMGNLRSNMEAAGLSFEELQ